jgi:U3 small nucleolar RNA-associated protein 3
MGKKRKVNSGGAARNKSPEPTSAKLALNSWEDVVDSEDEFLLNRDRILLDEGPDAKRRRKVAEEGTNFGLVHAIGTKTL